MNGSSWPRQGRVALALVGLIGSLWSLQAPALPLWEVSGTSNRVLLLGSIHFLRASDYPLDPAITAAFDQAGVVYMELDMDDLEPVATARAVAGLARDPGGRQLPELLGPRAWRAASSEIRALGLDPAGLVPWEPWYAAVLVTQLRLAQLGFDQSLGVEARLAADAERDHKEIRGLETLEGQLGALDSLSAEAQRDFLQGTLEEAAAVDDMAAAMITAWKSGDVAALEGDLLASVREQPELYQTLILRRNEGFARTIGQLVGDRQDYLVVMGALHLVGPDSVLKLLARQGIASRQVGTD